MPSSEYLYRGTRPDEADELIELWLAVFPSANRGILRSFLETDPWRDCRFGRVCEHNGRLVSIAYIGFRPVSTRFGVRKMGGIGYVGTLPEYRGRGINTEVMRDCLRVMEEERADFSTLITPINPYYERVGYQTVSRPFLVITPGSEGWPADTENAGGFGIAPPVSELLAVYRAFNAERPISVVRDEAYWKGWVAVRHAGARWICIRSRGKLVGYAAVSLNEEEIHVQEYGWLPDESGVVTQIASGLIALAASERKPLIRVNAPLEERLRSAIRKLDVYSHVDLVHNAMFRRICMDEAEYKTLCEEISSGYGTFWPADAT